MRSGVILALALIVGGCGVSSSDHVSTADPSSVPFGLLEEDETQTTTTLPELTSRQIAIWLVAGETIVPVRRAVTAPATAVRVLDALVDGPSADEAALGLRSAVPEGSIVDVDVTDELATIALTQDLAGAPPRIQVFALGQLVYTATEITGIDRVAFTIDGEPIDVPRGDGSVSDGPVDREDYAPLADPAR